MFKEKYDLRPCELLALYSRDDVNHVVEFNGSNSERSYRPNWAIVTREDLAQISEANSAIPMYGWRRAPKYIGTSQQAPGIYDTTTIRADTLLKIPTPLELFTSNDRIVKILDYIGTISPEGRKRVESAFDPEDTRKVWKVKYRLETDAYKLKGVFTLTELIDLAGMGIYEERTNPFPHLKGTPEIEVLDVFHIPANRFFDTCSGAVKWKPLEIEGDKWEFWRLHNSGAVMDAQDIYSNQFTRTAIITARNEEEAKRFEMADAYSWRDLKTLSWPMIPDHVVAEGPLGLSYNKGPEIIEVNENDPE